jgi:hypothetical protein
MIRVEYGAVIGLDEPIAWKLEIVTGHIPKNVFLGQSHRCI